MAFTATEVRNESDNALQRAKVKLNWDASQDKHLLWSTQIGILAEDVLRYKQKAEFFRNDSKDIQHELDDALDVIKEGRTNQMHYLESLNEDWIDAKNTIESLREELAKALWVKDQD